MDMTWKTATALVLAAMVLLMFAAAESASGAARSTLRCAVWLHCFEPGWKTPFPKPTVRPLPSPKPRAVQR
jgi:hypothetical protein